MLRVLVAIAMLPAIAAAQPCDPALERCRPENFTRGFGILGNLELSAIAKIDSAEADVVSVVSGHLAVSIGRPRVRYFATLDLAAGATFEDAGFAYDAALLPVGVGVQLGSPQHTAFIGVATGVGASGASAALPSAAGLPIQLVSVVRLTQKLNLLTRARATWFFTTTPRDDGARLGDELDGILAIQRTRFHNYLDGFYLGVAYRELGGAQFLGVVFGTAGGEEVFQEN